ncbi:uncharacterized protein LOC105228571 [Bactrocera dorsalis]|uniref:Uncharacterized protein LOC105228571 n=1 Tax=Bactrocera dorsalis TaxID=27457 RepID=A0A6I9VRU2_BACDO|nr:uncharacterized protein LOC105228571 [Bactrocera dorsalis]
MEPFNVIQTKAKRVRSNPTKKWLLKEEKSLVEFLTHNREFEKPTSQIYYRRFAKENNIAVDWKVARSKVRYMRITYNKAKAWESSIGARSMEGETIKSTLLKMCTFFYEMDEIFGGRLLESAVINESLESNDNSNYSELDLNELPSFAAVNESECGNKTIRKRKYSRTAESEILQFLSEIIQLKKQKIEQEKSFKEKELELRERELVIMEKGMELRAKQKLVLKDKEMEMKLKELQSKEKLKIMELQMKERLKMEELKHKYK